MTCEHSIILADGNLDDTIMNYSFFICESECDYISLHKNEEIMNSSFSSHNHSYDIIASCWIYKAGERLLFCEIVIKLRGLIQSGSNNGQENRPYFVLEPTL